MATEYVLLTDEDKRNLLRDRLYQIETELYRREVGAIAGDPEAAATGPGSVDSLKKAHDTLSASYKELEGTSKK